MVWEVLGLTEEANPAPVLRSRRSSNASNVLLRSVVFIAGVLQIRKKNVFAESSGHVSSQWEEKTSQRDLGWWIWRQIHVQGIVEHDATTRGRGTTHCSLRASRAIREMEISCANRSARRNE